jgi:hypothetical protein
MAGLGAVFPEIRMTTSKMMAAVLIVSAASLLPTLSQARSHHRHHGAHTFYGLPYPISFLHNYGPGPQPGTFAYYDGPSTNHCYQSSAAYLGQDRRTHPCF